MPKDSSATRSPADLRARVPVDLIGSALKQTDPEPSLETVVGHVLASVCDIWGAASSAVFILDDARETAAMRWVWRDGTLQAGKDDKAHPSGGRALPQARVLTWEERFGDKARPLLIHIASHPGVSEEIRAWARKERYSTILALPLRCGERITGSLSLRFRQDPQLTPQDLDLAQGLTDQAAPLLGLTHRAEEKEAAAVLEENRIAGEMHDTVAQGLAGIILRLDMALAKLGQDAAEARGDLEIAVKVARETLSQARTSVWALGEATREERDLVRALDRLAQEGSPGGGARIETRIDGIVPELPYRISDNLFQIAREAVANALRHSEARIIKVTLTSDPADLRLEVTDDGRGFVTLPKAVRRGFGLNIMEKRSRSLGGEFSMVSRVGEGVTIAVRVPLTSLHA
jgi:signal transduction histidine kinase